MNKDGQGINPGYGIAPMKLRHIEVFQAIRQAGSVSGAAQLLHVSQPAVSKVLQHAEQQLGFPLFLRVRGKLLATPEALELEREVAKLSDSLQAVRRLAQNLRRQPGHSLRIGATPALALSLLPRAIGEWSARYPQSGCELATLHSRELVQGLLMRELDLALSLKQPEHPGLRGEAIASGVLVALAPREHWPEAERRQPLSLAGLFRALVGEALGADPRALPVARDACLEENYWQALRYGCAGRYLVEGRCVGAGDWLEMAWRQCRPQARQGNEWAYQHACGLLEETSAARQLRRYRRLREAGQERHPALRRLVEELLEENLQPALAG
ncbi:MAG: LysR substrate-binding domain-containing protein [Pseudomonas aeruginosa]|nr:LysR substrate-binding domain-containing protein [Pseudomonas aeruginosa]